VAAELFISIKTVQFHLTHIYSKLNLTSRTELAAHLRNDVQSASDKLVANAGGYVETGSPAG
jgi:hypothetical protein